MIDEGATIGVSISGALTPAGLSSVLVPLIERGFIDYISSTGANLYHDLHFDLGLPLYRGSADVATGAHDVKLRKDGIIRVYDVLFPADVLYKTDEWVYRVHDGARVPGACRARELHHQIGKYALETAQARLGVEQAVAAGGLPRARRAGLGRLAGRLDHRPQPVGHPHRLPRARRRTWTRPPTSPRCRRWCSTPSAAQGGLSGVVILGGGAPKNFLLQTEPQLQEILGVAEKGHDYFIQITDARPDTGGLSGATPAEAVSWGKIDPEQAARHRGLLRRLDDRACRSSPRTCWPAASRASRAACTSACPRWSSRCAPSTARPSCTRATGAPEAGRHGRGQERAEPAEPAAESAARKPRAPKRPQAALAREVTRLTGGPTVLVGTCHMDVRSLQRPAALGAHRLRHHLDRAPVLLQPGQRPLPG